MGREVWSMYAYAYDFTYGNVFHWPIRVAQLTVALATCPGFLV